MLVYELGCEIDTDIHANVGKITVIALDIVGKVQIAKPCAAVAETSQVGAVEADSWIDTLIAEVIL
eukprot:scaffold25763_cov151-Skeletonema_dohrnii-CCMP3373.AAC.1